MGRFHNWIDKYGRTNLAKRLGISPPAVTYWLQSMTSPKASTMAKLLELGKGKFTLQDILADTGKIPAKRGK